MNENKVIIRKFEVSDRGQLRAIACDTAFIGEDWKNFFDDAEILADALTVYYTDYEPESCFVAVYDGKVIGYIIGAKDIFKARRILNFKIIPGLLVKILLKGLFLKRNTGKFLLNVFLSFCKGEFFSPDFSKAYPAALHINIDKNFRRKNIGQELIEFYLNFLKENKVEGVHFGVISEQGKAFFTKLGFEVLWTGKRPYLKYYLGRDLEYNIFGRRLS